jgi:hypothetical protein
MTQIQKFSVFWTGLVPAFETLLSHWNPPILSREIAYRDHLFNFLLQAVPPDAYVEKEYRHRGTTTDLWVKWQGFFQKGELAIELKLNLKKKTECDRLVGQLESLNPKENPVLLVLIGETDPVFFNRINEKYKQPQPNSEPPKFAIVKVLPTHIDRQIDPLSITRPT